jgi:hypothetical protein
LNDKLKAVRLGIFTLYTKDTLKRLHSLPAVP